MSSKDKSQSLLRMGFKEAHLARHIANTDAIHQTQNQTIELSEQASDRPGAGLASIFS